MPSGWAAPAESFASASKAELVTTLRLYVNGALAVSTSVAGPLATSSGPLRIGGNSIWPEWFSGLIDEIRIYNRALSQLEIQTDMAAAIKP